jgi:hypothetical protein
MIVSVDERIIGPCNASFALGVRRIFNAAKSHNAIDLFLTSNLKLIEVAGGIREAQI